MLLQSGFKSLDSFSNVGFATTTRDPVHYPGLLVLRQCVLRSCETGAECASKLEDHLDVETRANVSDLTWTGCPCCHQWDHVAQGEQLTGSRKGVPILSEYTFDR